MTSHIMQETVAYWQHAALIAEHILGGVMASEQLWGRTHCRSTLHWALLRAPMMSKQLASQMYCCDTIVAIPSTEHCWGRRWWANSWQAGCIVVIPSTLSSKGDGNQRRSQNTSLPYTHARAGRRRVLLTTRTLKQLRIFLVWNRWIPANFPYILGVVNP
jgi:hypothetical protein